MNRWEFEQICIDSRLRPVMRHNTKNSVVLIADGWFPKGHPDRPYPHYRTVWAIGKGDDELTLGRDLYFEGKDTSTLQERISAASEDALTAIVGAERARELIAEHRNPERLYHA